MFKALKISISLILSILILTSTFFALDVEDNAGQGNNSQSTTGSWYDYMQGYRISVYLDGACDKVLDFTFSTPSSGLSAYDTNKLGASSSNATSPLGAPSGMPKAVTGSGSNLYVHGIELRNWLIANDAENLKSLLKYNFGYSSDDLNSENENNKLDGMKVMVEPIFWFELLGWNRNTRKQIPTGITIYGTISNIAEFCSGNTAKLGNNCGGGMANLIGGAGADSLVLIERDDVLNINKPQLLSGENEYYPNSEVANPEIGLGAHIYTPKDLFDDEPEEDEEPESTNLTLEQSQITKRVSTSNSDLFGEYRLEFKLPALNPNDEHPYDILDGCDGTDSYGNYCGHINCDCPELEDGECRYQHVYTGYCPIDQVADSSIEFKFICLKNTKQI